MNEFTLPAGFKEASAPEQFKFEKKGDVLDGILLKIERRTIKGDAAIELYVSTGRRIFTFIPGFDVRSKLNRRMVGKRIIVRYVGDDHEKGKEGNPMKVFGVYWKDDAGPTADGDPGITDDDIPF
jgi:hypothetical protein